MGTQSKLGPSPIQGEYLNYYYNKKGQHISDAEGQHSGSDNFTNPTGRTGWVGNTAALICLINSALMELKISNNSTKKTRNGSTHLGL